MKMRSRVRCLLVLECEYRRRRARRMCEGGDGGATGTRKKLRI